MNEGINEVASFWYRVFDDQPIEFDVFVSQNRRLLRKLSLYPFAQWSEAIEETEDLVDALIILNAHYGVPYRIDTACQTRNRYLILQSWEAKWGELSKDLRIMFIRSPKFNYIQFEDIDILKGLFEQHKKFDSVKEHLYQLQLVTMSNDLVDWEFASIFTGLPEDVLLAVDEEDDASVIYLSSQVGIDIDWNPEELGSEAILGLTGSSDEF
jgi:hypothetical protein